MSVNKTETAPEYLEMSYGRPKSLNTKPFTYCPGCPHGNIHHIIAELIDEYGIQDRCIGVAPVGCSVFCYEFFDFDFISSAHGRAPAVATGIKRSHPDSFVFTYQGDGDLASIGTAEIIHAANRGENMLVLFLNNGIYGMTGGQMAPTSLIGMKTTTSPDGRASRDKGFPIHMAEMLAPLKGVAFCARTSSHDVKHLIKTKAALRKAFKAQLENRGFAIVEVLAGCPINMRMDPRQAAEWVKEQMLPEFPLGTYKDCFAEASEE